MHEATPGGGWKILTILGALSTRDIVAAMTVEEPTDADIFLAYLDRCLCPALRPGDVVVMDNLSAHKACGVRERIEAASAELLYLPPYSPDLNRIERPGPSSRLCLADPKHAPPKPSIKPSRSCCRRSPRTTPKPGSDFDLGHLTKCENALKAGV